MMCPIDFQTLSSRSQEIWELTCEHDKDFTIECIWMKISTYFSYDKRMHLIKFKGKKKHSRNTGMWITFVNKMVTNHLSAFGLKSFGAYDIWIVCTWVYLCVSIVCALFILLKNKGITRL